MPLDGSTVVDVVTNETTALAWLHCSFARIYFTVFEFGASLCGHSGEGPS